MTEHVFSERGLYYRLGGNAQAEQTIVLIHGLSGSSSAWVDFEAYFSTEYRILSFDLRGHGFSVRPQSMDAYTPRHMAEDVVALLQHLNIEHPVLIGHSLGSLILFELLRMHPALPSKVVFLSPEYDLSRRLLSRIAHRALLPVALLQLFSFRQPHGRHVSYAPRYIGTGDWNMRRMIADIRATGVRSFLYSTYHALGVRCEGVAEQVNCPVLLIHGKRDTIFPVQNTYQLAHTFPHATSYIIDNADHILVLNHAQEILPRIASFFQA